MPAPVARRREALESPRLGLTGHWRPGTDYSEEEMATTAKIAKEAKTPKFKVRLRNRCQRCGRPRAYMRKFALCRLCFRKLALEGDIAGRDEESW